MTDYKKTINRFFYAVSKQLNPDLNKSTWVKLYPKEVSDEKRKQMDGKKYKDWVRSARSKYFSYCKSRTWLITSFLKKGTEVSPHHGPSMEDYHTLYQYYKRDQEEKFRVTEGWTKNDEKEMDEITDNRSNVSTTTQISLSEEEKGSYKENINKCYNILKKIKTKEKFHQIIILQVV